MTLGVAQSLGKGRNEHYGSQRKGHRTGLGGQSGVRKDSWKRRVGIGQVRPGDLRCGWGRGCLEWVGKAQVSILRGERQEAGEGGISAK